MAQIPASVNLLQYDYTHADFSGGNDSKYIGLVLGELGVDEMPELHAKERNVESQKSIGSEINGVDTTII